MTRPTQLSAVTLVLLIASASLSFVSGVLVWWAQTQQLALDSTPVISVQPWLTIHGALNPVLCVIFGFLWTQHGRPGWRFPKFRMTGIAMVTVFAGLIISGTGLYYAGGESLRAVLVWWHRVFGLALPLILFWHGFLSYRRARNGEV